MDCAWHSVATAIPLSLSIESRTEIAGRGRRMRSGIHGTFATLLLMVPVLSIPALAIFGIPQFAPVVASPLDENPKQDRERRVGQSARPAGDAFMEDLEDAPAFGSQPAEQFADSGSGQIGDSVPLSRPGFGDSNHSPSADPRRVRPLGNTTAAQKGVIQAVPSWHSEPVDDRRQVAPLEETSMGRVADQSSIDLRDNRRGQQMGATTDFPKARIHQVSDQNTTQIPRVYQRQRDVPIAQPGDQNAVAEPEALTWQGAVRRLNDLEIRNFRLQPGHRDNQFVFICSYTPSDSPRVSYRFEAEADEPLKAVEKVLEQIAEWQQRR